MTFQECPTKNTHWVGITQPRTSKLLSNSRVISARMPYPSTSCPGSAARTGWIHTGVLNCELKKQGIPLHTTESNQASFFEAVEPGHRRWSPACSSSPQSCEVSLPSTQGSWQYCLHHIWGIWMIEKMPPWLQSSISILSFRVFLEEHELWLFSNTSHTQLLFSSLMQTSYKM